MRWKCPKSLFPACFRRAAHSSLSSPHAIIQRFNVVGDNRAHVEAKEVFVQQTRTADSASQLIAQHVARHIVTLN